MDVRRRGDFPYLERENLLENRIRVDDVVRAYGPGRIPSDDEGRRPVRIAIVEFDNGRPEEGVVVHVEDPLVDRDPGPDGVRRIVTRVLVPRRGELRTADRGERPISDGQEQSQNREDESENSDPSHPALAPAAGISVRSCRSPHIVREGRRSPSASIFGPDSQQYPGSMDRSGRVRRTSDGPRMLTSSPSRPGADSRVSPPSGSGAGRPRP